nr:MAG TPA: hypothetical protein [Bacteriophage sp.]
MHDHTAIPRTFFDMLHSLVLGLRSIALLLQTTLYRFLKSLQ